MEDNTEQESHTLPELPFEEKKFAAVTELLALNDIPINPDDALEREFTGWLTPRLLEKRMLEPIPPLDPNVIGNSLITITYEEQKKRNDLQQKVETVISGNSQHNTSLDPLLVFSRAGLDLLLRNEKKEFKVLFGDLSGLRWSNLVHKTEGNRRLRKIARALLQNLGNKDQLAAWGGDEFVVILESDEAYAQFCSKLQIEQASGKEQLRTFSHEATFANNRRTVFLNPLSISFKPSGENFLEKKEFTSNDVVTRETRLIKFHHELEKYITHFKQKLPHEAFNTFLWILENSLFDPLLQKVYEKQSEKYSVSGDVTRQVTGYKDIEDLKEHLGEENGEYALMRIDFPGIMKFVNDHMPESYRAGNALITHTVEHIINYFFSECGLSDVRFMRRGIDFYVVIPRSQKTPPLTYTELLLYSQNLQYTLLPKAVSFEERDHEIYVISNATSELYIPCVTGYSFFSGNNLEKAMDLADYEVSKNTLFRIQENINELFSNYERAVSDEDIIDNLGKYKDFFNKLNSLGNYFNPHEKRGPDRMEDNFGFEEEILKTFLEYYEPDNSKTKDGEELYRFTSDPHMQLRFLRLLENHLSKRK